MNRTVVLTGATGRIGRHIAKNLAKAGSNLALVCRDEAAGEAMAKELRLHNPQSLVNVHCCDLTSTEAVRGLAAELHNSYPRVHSLVNAAGIMSPSPRGERGRHREDVPPNALAPQLMVLLRRCCAPRETRAMTSPPRPACPSSATRT